MKDYGNVYSVYVHTCPNGKRYVGMTRRVPEKRWRNGSGYRNQKRFSADIKLYGWNNIDHVIVLENADYETASAKEKELIATYETQNPEKGYNVKNGGQTFEEHSDEFLQALKERMTGNTYCVGRKISQKHIEALRRANTGSHHASPFKGKQVHSAEVKQLLSKLSKARWENEEYRERMLANRPDMHGENNPMYGRKQTDHAKRLISEKAKDRTWSDERKKEFDKTREPMRKAVVCFDNNMNIVKQYHSIKEAAQDTGLPNTNIGFACRNKSIKRGGFFWRYANECGVTV